MNKIGISLHFGFDIPTTDGVALIKDANIDNIITTQDKRFKKANGTIGYQIKVIKKNGIGVSSLHMTYKTKFLPFFWQKSKIGNKIEKSLIKDIKTAHKYGFNCVVVHLDGEPNNIGIERIKRVLKYCKKYNTPIAVENIDHNQCLFKVFEEIDDDYLKLCFDIGHNNVWNKDVDFLTKYANKLICLHLHDNNGLRDEHTLNKYGTIDWDNFARKIAKINPDINLDYELLLYKKPTTDTPKDIVSEVYKQGKELSLLIQKYKNN